MFTNPRRWMAPQWVDLYDGFRWEWESSKGRLFQKKIYRFPQYEYLNLGCGNSPESLLSGFLNVDFFRWHQVVDFCADLRFPLRLESNTWKGIFCEQVLEHLPRTSAPGFLGECHRVLRPGGILRLSVPDAEYVMGLYNNGSPEATEKLKHIYPFVPPFKSRMDAVNHVFRDNKFNAHLWAYDFESLALLLEEAGFSRIQRQPHDTSEDAFLAKNKAHWAAVSLHVDATKSS